jgi:methyltransferase
VSGGAVAYAVLAVMALQRLGELFLSNRNTRILKAQGAVESGAGHYVLIVALHVCWLLAVLVFLPQPTPVLWPLIAVLAVAQLMRLWVVMTLGPYWTTRIISVPGAPLVKKGPYRFLRHPNYVVVVVEIAALPLAFGEVTVAVVFSIINAGLLSWRIQEEDAALMARRALP